MEQSGNREKFVRLAEARVNKAVKAIQLVGNLSDRTNYAYSETDAKKIVAALTKEVNAVRVRFGPGADGKQATFKL